MMRRPTFSILKQGDDWIAVDKPAGLSTVPGRGHETSALQILATMLDLPAHGSSDPRVRVVHRLDRDTTGVLIFATSSRAQRQIGRLFMTGNVKKEYLALVSGCPQGVSGTIDAPIAPHPTRKGHMTVTRLGKQARTDWTIEQQFRNYSLLRVFPRTGRTHQIRVHLKQIGCPLAIDPLYNPENRDGMLCLSRFKRGYKPSGAPERPLISRLTLHAHRLTADFPGTGPIVLEAPVPRDLRAVVQVLGKWNR
jgi:23S rRNA pseudouridine955/2504/2580 synthase/23S rRNA pseudouridine1911/1915/1917 synthase